MNATTPLTNPFLDASSPDLSNLTDTPSGSEQTGSSAGEKFVVFFLDDELFAVPAEQTAEIVRLLEWTPLPNSPAWLHGIANLRGTIISVLNLAKLCGKKSVAVLPKSKLVVLKPQNSTAAVAFPVDRMSEIITLSPQDVEPAEDARFIGKTALEKNPVKLLDTENLFSSLL